MISHRFKMKLLQLIVIIFLALGVLHNIQTLSNPIINESSEMMNFGVSFIKNSINTNNIQDLGNITEKIGISVFLAGKVSIDSLKWTLERSSIPKNRELIKSMINENPGITLREIKRASGLAMGVLQYHINYLENSNEIEAIRYGRSKHFFSSYIEYSQSEKFLFSLIRNIKIRDILHYIASDNRKSYQSNLVKFTGESRSLISYYIRLLKEKGVISSIDNQLHLTKDCENFFKIHKNQF